MEPQTIQITFNLKTKHTPDNEAHLKHVAQEYFRTKGIILSDQLVIEA